jgi:hypothetical protein
MEAMETVFAGLASSTPISRRQSLNALHHARYMRLSRSLMVPASNALASIISMKSDSLASALDQNTLHAVGIAADMGGQFSPRGYENLTLTGAPIEALKQPVLPCMRPERRSTPLLGLFHWRHRHAAN